MRISDWSSDVCSSDLQHDVALEDGSRVRLDTNSALVVRYSRKHRDVVLERGRAQFDVAHAPQRPFTVHAGPGTVRAVGTQFQVQIGRASGRERVCQYV